MMIKTRKSIIRVFSLIIVFMLLLSSMPSYVNNNVSAEDETGIELNSFSLQFISGAKDVGEGLYEWTPYSSAMGHRFLFRVSYSFSGTGYMPRGSINFTMPLHILKDRNDRYADKFEMSLPKQNEASSRTDFAYKVTGDEIIVTNTREISAAENGYFEIAYETTKKTFDYRDMSVSDNCAASVSISRNGQTLTETSSAYRVRINTNAEIYYLYKSAPDRFYQNWRDAWGEPPENADAYYYLEWNITTYVYATQPYKLTFIDNFDCENGEVVGYKLSGSEQYIKAEGVSVSRQKNVGYRSDKVITRHSKLVYESLEQYDLENNINVEITPEDGYDESNQYETTASYRYDTPVFVVPYGNWNAWQYGTTSWQEHYSYEWDTADYRLEELKSGKLDYLDGNIKYCIYAIGMPYPRTLEENADEEDYRNYGKANVNYVITSDKYYFTDQIKTEKEVITVPEDTQTITSEDYEIEYLTYSMRINDADFDEKSQRFRMKKGTFNENDILYFDAKFGDGGDWTENVASYNFCTGELTYNDEYVKSITKKRIDFKENCTAFRIRTSNAHYRTQIEALPYLKLRRSQNVLDLTGDKDRVWITGISDYTVTDAKGDSVFHKDILGRDYITGIQKKVDISKTVTGVTNDKANETAIVSWKAEVEENSISAAGREYITQDTGVFYDLLPIGCELDMESVAVQNEKEDYLSENDYEVIITPDYDHTGRTLAVIRIKTRFNKATLTYSTYYSWDDIVDYGMLLLNSIAYETGNEALSDGFPDNGGLITEADLLANLDAESEGDRFQYAEHQTVVDVTRSASLGLTKTVKGINDKSYKHEITVKQGSDYTYRLRYVSSLEGGSMNIILYDSLENYKDGEKISDFHSTLKEVDVRQIVNLGAAPVIYYSSEEELDLTQKPDLNEEKNGRRVWLTEDEFGDISEARAVAIDLSKNAEGEDFILEPERSVVALLKMTAPEEDNTADHYPHSYNEVYLSNTIYDEEHGEIQDYYIHHSYTDVQFRIYSDIGLLKTDEDDDELFIKGVGYTLEGTSDYDNVISKTLYTDKNGKLTFKDIEKGEYSLYESSGTEDYQVNPEPMTVVIDSHGDVFINGSKVNKGSYYHVTDENRVHTNIEFYKRDMNRKERLLNGAEFELTGYSDYGGEITMYAVSSGGKIVFENVEKGTYYISEIKAPANYQLGTTVYKAVIDEAGVAAITIDTSKGKPDLRSLEKNEYGAYSIFNDSYHSFSIFKKGYNYGMPVEGAVFRFTGTSDKGNEFDITKTTPSNGTLTFDELEEGIYVLTETEAPSGYQCDSTPRAVQINRDGTVTIEGLEQDEYGDFVITNKEAGTITIIKKWIDSDSSSRYESGDSPQGQGSSGPSPNAAVQTIDRLMSFFTGDSKNTQRADPVRGNTDSNDVTPKLPEIIISSAIPTPYAVFGGGNERSVLSDIVALNQIRSFVHFTGESSVLQEKINDGTAVRIDNEATDYKIYGWFDSETGTVFWWSDARKVYLSDDSHYLWNGLSACVSIDFSDIDTSMLTDMSKMFKDCSAMTSIDLSTFNTSRVTNMYELFRNCSSLTLVDLTNIDTSAVTNMGRMFAQCTSIKHIDFSHLSTASVTTTEYMFHSCSNLLDFDLSGHDMSKNLTMMAMFYRCTALKNVDLSNTDSINCTSLYGTFYGCTALEYVNLTNFRTPSVENLSMMFYNCSKVNNLDFSSFETPYLTTIRYMFRGCSSLETLDLSTFDTSNVTTMYGAFANCTSLTALDTSSFNTSNVTEMDFLFSQCNELESIDLTGFDTRKVTSFYCMFQACFKLEVIDVSKFDTSKATNMEWMFNHCRVVKKLDVTNFDTRNITSMKGMFQCCYELQDIDVSGFDTSNVTDMNSMFNYCYEVKALDVSGFDVSNVKSFYAMFGNCKTIEELDVSGFNTVSAEEMTWMFGYVEQVEELDCSGFVLKNVANTTSMFSHDYALKTIYVSDLWDIDDVSGDTDFMFNGDSALEGECGTPCTATRYSKAYAHIDTTENPGYLSYKESSFPPYVPKMTNETYFAEGDELESVLVRVCELSDILAFRHFDGDAGTVNQLVNTGKAVRIDNSIDLNPPIYAWLDDDGTLYWYSQAVSVYLADEAHCLWRGLTNCSDIDLDGITTTTLTDASHLFEDCASLKQLDLSGSSFAALTNMSYMFSGCTSLESINTSSFKPSAAADISYMFADCSSLKSVDIQFSTSKVTDFSHLFSGCTSLETLNAIMFFTSAATDLSYMFNGCSSLAELDISKFVTNTVTDMSYMFAGCEKLTSLNTRVLDTSQATSLEGMFKNCKSMASFSISGFDVSNVSYMGSMFEGCSELTVLDLSDYSTSDVTDMTRMFSGCEKLKTIYATDKWSTDNLLTSSDMFEGCNAIVGGNGTRFDADKKDGTMAYIDEEDQPGYLTRKGTTYGVVTYTTDSDNCEVDIIDDDTWVFTYTGLDPNTIFYVWEEDYDGYESTNARDNFIVLQNNTATIINRSTTEEIPEEKFGSLSLTKKLSGDNLNDDDISRKFLFTVTLTDTQGAALSGNAVFGQTAFRDGTAKVRLASDETVTFTDIPEGYHYTVTEQAAEIFSTESENSTGTIAADTEASVIFTNIKSAVPEETNHFRLKKVVNGNFESDNESYSFNISFTGLHSEQVYHLSDGSTFRADSLGRGFISVYLSNGDELTVEGLPVGSEYRVTEQAGDYISSYYVQNNAEEGRIANGRAFNTEKERTLSTSLESVDSGEDILITFYNTKDIRQSIVIKKVVENISDDNSDVFRFTLDLDGLSENETVRTSSKGRYRADAAGRLSIDFYLSDGESTEIYDLPVGSHYTVTESSSDYIASYEITDTNSRSKILQPADSNSVTDKALSTAEETVNEGEQAEIVFTNRKIQHDVTLTKLVDMTYGNEPYSSYKNYQFVFTAVLRGLEPDTSYVLKYTDINTTGTLMTRSYTSNDSGEAVIEIKLTHGDSCTFKNLPLNASYRITEQGCPRYISSFGITANGGSEITAVSGQNQETNTSLSTSSETVDSSDLDVKIVFTNTYTASDYVLPSAGMHDSRPLQIILCFGLTLIGVLFIFARRRLLINDKE